MGRNADRMELREEDRLKQQTLPDEGSLFSHITSGLRVLIPTSVLDLRYMVERNKQGVGEVPYGSSVYGEQRQKGPSKEPSQFYPVTALDARAAMI